MPKLNVNIDHIATLRQARLGFEPGIPAAARIVEEAGSNGITVHLREDRRHIQDRDVYSLRKTIKTKLNLEMAATEEILGIAADVKPEWATLVPEKRKELTTESGLDLFARPRHLEKAVAMLKKKGIKVSLFIDPDLSAVRKSQALGADFIELHTGRYAELKNKAAIKKEFMRLQKSAELAQRLGLGVNAGHGLNYNNVSMLRKIEEIEEYSIGHSIISRAVFTGLRFAVLEMLKLVR